MRDINKNYKDSLFTNLFSTPDKRNLLELYLALHPEDTTADVDDLTLITIENTLITDIYNDLGFMVRNRLIVLAEAQSTWSPNVLVRMFFYIARTYQDYIYSNKKLKDKLYSGSKLVLPQVEAYVLYADKQNDKPDFMSLKEEFLSKSNIDLTVNIIYADSERRDIIGQYLMFCMIVREQLKLHTDLKVAIREAINICIKCGNLSDYLSKHRLEVEDIMLSLLTQEEVIECYGNNMRDEGHAEGLAQGHAEGLSQGLTETISALKEFYPDFESLYNAKLANNTTYSQFSKEEIYQIYEGLQ